MRIAESVKLVSQQNGQNAGWQLLSWYLNRPKEWLFLNQNSEIGDDFCAIANRYNSGEPLEYITGRCEFLDREFLVGKGVLIPRFETEILVQKAINLIKDLGARSGDGVRIIDIGTGSGVIAISLFLALPDAKIFASDISQTALNWARKNCERFGAKIELIKSDLFGEISGEFDIIISNTPYVSEDFAADIWVQNEPQNAVFAAENGAAVLKRLIKEAAKKSKWLLCEMGFDQKDILSGELENSGFEAEFYKDLAGFDRGFVARKI